MAALSATQAKIPTTRLGVRAWVDHADIWLIIHFSSSCTALGPLRDIGFDPVQYAARWVFAIQHLPADTPLGTFVDERGQQKQATATDIRTAILIGAVGDNLASCGYTLSHIRARIAVSNSSIADLNSSVCFSRFVTRCTVVREITVPFWVKIQ